LGVRSGSEKEGRRPAARRQLRVRGERSKYSPIDVYGDSVLAEEQKLPGAKEGRTIALQILGNRKKADKVRRRGGEQGLCLKTEKGRREKAKRSNRKVSLKRGGTGRLRDLQEKSHTCGRGGIAGVGKL